MSRPLRVCLIALVAMSCGWLLVGTYHLLPDEIALGVAILSLLASGLVLLLAKRGVAPPAPRVEVRVLIVLIPLLVMAISATVVAEVLIARGVVLGGAVRIAIGLLDVSGFVSGILIAGQVRRWERGPSVVPRRPPKLEPPPKTA